MTPPDGRPPFDDVRMRGFGRRTSVADALALLADRVAPLPTEHVSLMTAAGRVLAAAVVSEVDVPAFPRAAMDGFAVRAADTVSATESAPARLAVVGESLPGRPFAGTVGGGQAVRIMTGAPVPTGADAVVVAEAAAEEGGWVAVRAAVTPGRHVARVGEDVARGRPVLPAGRTLRPQDVGLLAAIGVGVVPVVRRPRVAVFVTGDELLPPGTKPEGFRVVDSNSPMLAALIARDGGECLGGECLPVRTLPDRFEAVRDALAGADADIVLVSGGSSVGTEDHAPRAVAAAGELPVHGVGLKPAGPTGIGFVGGRPVLLLPGNPVSCLCGYDLFAGRAVRRLGGRPWELPYHRVTRPLAATLASAAGRVDYARVTVEAGAVRPLAVGGASNLSTAVAADGFVLVPADRASLESGEAVEVWLYDEANP